MSEYSKREIEARGQNVEAAVVAGLAKLGLSRSDVIVEILDEGSRGLLGIGAREAVVRLTAMTPVRPPQPAAKPVTPPVARPVVQPVAKPAAVTKPPQAAEEEETDEGDVLTTPVATTPVATDRPAVIDADPEEATLVQNLLQTMLAKMHVPASVQLDVSEPDDLTGQCVNVFNIHGDDLNVLVGPRGETLGALQYITRLMASHQLQRRANFVLDVQGYRQRREAALTRLAERMAQKAKQQRRPISLEPMSPYERRIIHMTLRDHKEVYTQSVGEGDRRKVRILPK
ncbi:MAG: Jag N-terminal domain-containing protein [Anaerolinea sp.]|nr:Jag N-terminal domain-containing protein [Anaerolinea sp.]